MDLPSLKEHYESLLQQLNALAHDANLSADFPKHAIFIDNILLQLKVWAAAVDLDNGGVELAEKIEPLNLQIHARLNEIKEECNQFEKTLEALRKDAHSEKAPSEDALEVLRKGTSSEEALVQKGMASSVCF
jgi:hypothetical protein